jgi:UDP-N-acetylglucosamine 2-epimerase (non-hydrolysing)
VGCDPKRIVTEALVILDGKSKAGCVPELWDGRAAERVLNVLVEMVEQQEQSMSVAVAHEWCQEVDDGNDA